MSDSLRDNLHAICNQLLPVESLSVEQRAELLDHLEHALQKAKLEAMAEFAAGAGHEINNPVATIAGRAQLLLANETDPERRHALEVIGGQALRIRDMIGDAMLFARPPQPRCDELNLLQIAELAIASQARLQQQKQAEISVEISPSLVLWADRTQLLVLLSSLVRNSLEAADRAGIKVQLVARSDPRGGHPGVVIVVADNGPGFTTEQAEHLFDPFYSGRQAGRGLGFGLSKCWRIAQMHGGEILAKLTPSGGATFEVWWPARS